MRRMPFLGAFGSILLRGETSTVDTKAAPMSDNALVATVLIIGGALFLAIFLWVAVVRVRASNANDPPPGLHGAGHEH